MKRTTLSKNGETVVVQTFDGAAIVDESTESRPRRMSEEAAEELVAGLVAAGWRRR